MGLVANYLLCLGSCGEDNGENPPAPDVVGAWRFIAKKAHE